MASSSNPKLWWQLWKLLLIKLCWINKRLLVAVCLAHTVILSIYHLVEHAFSFLHDLLLLLWPTCSELCQLHCWQGRSWRYELAKVEGHKHGNPSTFWLFQSSQHILGFMQFWLQLCGKGQQCAVPLLLAVGKSWRQTLWDTPGSVPSMMQLWMESC